MYIDLIHISPLTGCRECIFELREIKPPTSYNVCQLRKFPISRRSCKSLLMSLLIISVWFYLLLGKFLMMQNPWLIRRYKFIFVFYTNAKTVSYALDFLIFPMLPLFLETQFFSVFNYSFIGIIHVWGYSSMSFQVENDAVVALTLRKGSVYLTSTMLDLKTVCWFTLLISRVSLFWSLLIVKLGWEGP